MSSHADRNVIAPFALTSDRARHRFGVFAWVVLAYNLPVILWGAYVRVSFSGDGCGANWPFCNGQLIPQNMAAPTAIEFAHRMTTSVDSFLVLVLCAWAFLSFPRHHAVRLYAVLSVAFLFIEALLGAGLVVFRLVAKDQSAGRPWYLSAHLTNTLLLLAALVVTAWVARTNTPALRLRSLSRPVYCALAITIFISITGAITALGDTLFPASSLESGVRQDFSSASHMLLRLRVIHPVLAVTGAGYLVWLAAGYLRDMQYSCVKQPAAAVVAITVLQLAAGMVNLSLLAPLWMQLTHLLIADLLWIAVVILALETLRDRPRAAA